MTIINFSFVTLYFFWYTQIKTLSFHVFASALFPDVVNCMQTDNLELKKLVYLYLMNYAKSQPDMAIMAVNTFVKVCAKFLCLWPSFQHYTTFVDFGIMKLFQKIY